MFVSLDGDLLLLAATVVLTVFAMAVLLAAVVLLVAGVHLVACVILLVDWTDGDILFRHFLRFFGFSNHTHFLHNACPLNHAYL